MASERPAELQLDAQWDRCLDLAVRRGVYGALAGLGAGLILFRGGAWRTAAVSLALGGALGSAWADCQRDTPSPPAPPARVDADTQ